MQEVGVREFRDRLASFLSESEEPVAITRHGSTIGYYMPVRAKRTPAEREASRKKWERVQRVLKEKDLHEEELVTEFKRWRAGRVG